MSNFSAPRRNTRELQVVIALLITNFGNITKSPASVDDRINQVHTTTIYKMHRNIMRREAIVPKCIVLCYPLNSSHFLTIFKLLTWYASVK
jgi:hypothetical protein